VPLTSWAVFWGLSRIGQLPNPDPSDTSVWDKNDIIDKKDVKIDKHAEATRGELRRQVQEWAGLEVNPEAELFVFVGRWSQQKGIDLIADIFPTILAEYPSTQLICVGPTIDLYGKFAALKLQKLMERYPKRVFSKPEFTVLPPYVFSGAEFALIPSRDEPFGLVAVEFGRKGALGVGARVGGLGQMPGWWYTIESASTKHLLSQFKQAMVAALESKKDVRAMMRAWSAKQRFPVAQWVEQLEKLQTRAIKVHEKVQTKSSKKPMPLDFAASQETFQMFNQSSTTLAGPRDLTPRRPTTSHSEVGGLTPGLTPPPPFGFPYDAHSRTPSTASSITNYSIKGMTSRPFLDPLDNDFPLPAPPSIRYSTASVRSIASSVDIDIIIGDRKDFKLQQVDPFFTDSDGKFFTAFEKKLEDLSADNSIADYCIEEYLIKSERQWFDRYHDVKIGRSPYGSTTSLTALKKGTPYYEDNFMDVYEDGDNEQFGLAQDYVPPTGLRK
jgi:alpha-1,3-glucan synthase